MSDAVAVRAEIVAVGTELLLGQIVDSNSALLGEIFPEYGVRHYHRQTVGDNLGRLTEALQLALSRSDIVITIGGLGPTEDDLTREGIAAACGLTLRRDLKAEKLLREMFKRRGLPWVSSIARQADLPAGAVAIDNPNGTAPGVLLRHGSKVVVALPGPPNEFRPMVEATLRPLLKELAASSALNIKILKVVGMGESWIEERLLDLMRSDDPTVAPYAKTGEVHLRLASSRGEDLLEPLEQEIRARLGKHVYGVNEDTMASVIVHRLRARRETLAFAESCTGGLLGGAMTDIPGASDVFWGGWITYANAAKHQQLGVANETLEQEGAVSEATARAMADGARSNAATDWAISVTGIAGPGGGTPERPVGLVYFGIAGPRGIQVNELRLRGARATIRERTVALVMSKFLLELPES